jgi:hypothetical protein
MRHEKVGGKLDNNQLRVRFRSKVQYSKVCVVATCMWIVQDLISSAEWLVLLSWC